MEKLLGLVGTVCGILGTALCIAAGVARLSGTFTYAGSEVVIWFVLGIALVVVGCFGLLQSLSMRPR